MRAALCRRSPALWCSPEVQAAGRGAAVTQELLQEGFHRWDRVWGRGDRVWGLGDAVLEFGVWGMWCLGLGFLGVCC